MTYKTRSRQLKFAFIRTFEDLPPHRLAKVGNVE